MDSILSVIGLSHGVLEDVTFELESKIILAVLGPNGSGKTTLLKKIAGLSSLRGKSEGQIRYRNVLMNALSVHERAQRIAYLSSELDVAFPIRVEEMVELGNVGNSEHSTADCLQALKLEKDSRRYVHELSGGGRQRVLLARAMRQNPKIYLLDETLSKMDLHHQIEMGQWMEKMRNKNGATFVVVTHDYNLASEWASHGLILNSGSVVAAGTIEEVMTKDHLQKLYPGLPMNVIRTPKNNRLKVIFE